MNFQISRYAALTLASISIGFTGCSSGGGAGGGSSSGSSVANGVMSVPSATCGSSACLTSNSSLAVLNDANVMAVNSGETVADLGAQLYVHFNSTTVPKINSYLGRLETAFEENGVSTCAQAAGTTPSLDYPLGSGYTVDISAGVSGDGTVPGEFVGAGATVDRKYILKLNGTSVGKVLIHCSGAYRTIYARLQESPNKVEVWAQTNGTVKSIFGAIDDSTTKRSMYFTSSTATTFQMIAVANNITYGGLTTSVAISGDVDLASNGIAKIGFVHDASNASTVTPMSVSLADVNTNWSLSNIHHCYSNLNTATVEASPYSTCSSLGISTGLTRPIRGVSSTWSISGMNTAISTTF